MEHTERKREGGWGRRERERETQDCKAENFDFTNCTPAYLHRKQSRVDRLQQVIAQVQCEQGRRVCQLKRYVLDHVACHVDVPDLVRVRLASHLNMERCLFKCWFR